MESGVGTGARAELSAQTWRQIVDGATDTAIITLDLDGNVTSWNAGATRILGWSEVEMFGESLNVIFPPEEREGRLQGEMKAALEVGRGGGEEGWRIRRDGSRLWATGELTPIKDAHGGLIGFVKILRDRTSQRAAEENLAEERRLLEVMNRAGTALAVENDLHRLVQVVTDAGVELTRAQFGAFFYNLQNEAGEGYTLYTLSGAPREAFSKFPMPRNTAIFAPTFNGDGIVRSDDITADPRYGLNTPRKGMPPGHLPVRSYLAVPVVSRSGEVLGGLFFGHERVGVFDDRSERGLSGLAAEAAVAIDNARLYGELRTELARRRLAEATLGQTERRLQAILDNASVSIFLMDDRQHCVYMNPAAEALTGFRLEEMEGRPLHDVIHHTRPDGSHFPIHECAIDRAFLEDDQQRGEDVFVHKSGRFYPVTFTASPVRDEQGSTIGTVVEVRDITEERFHEETRTLLMREVDHRARNALAVVQSLVKLADASDLESYKTKLLGRISALARAQGNLADRKWEGASLKDLICDELTALCPSENFDVTGPDLLLQAESAQPVSMIIHELATNAFKYGSLSAPEGRVAVDWFKNGDEAVVHWREMGGPSVAPPAHAGFGSRLIRQLTRQLGATVRMEWEPGGLHATVQIPLNYDRVPGSRHGSPKPRSAQGVQDDTVLNSGGG